MLNANRFALIPAEKSANRGPAEPKRSARITRLLLMLAMLAATLWQAPAAALAQDSSPAASETVAEAPVGLDQKIDEAFGGATGWFVNAIFYPVPITDGVGVPWVLFPLVLGAIFFTLVFGFPNVRYFGTSIGIVAGRYDDLEKGERVAVAEEVTPIVTAAKRPSSRQRGSEESVFVPARGSQTDSEN